MRTARRAGTAFLPAREGRLTRYEAILERHRWRTGGLSSTCAGAARLARLDAPPVDPRGRALRGVAAGVVAPTMVGYLLWIFRHARERRLRRLYFLARDGQALLEVAHVLAPRLGVQCELRYLYGSRQALNLAAMTVHSDEQLAWVLTHPATNTLRNLLARVGLRAEEVGDELIELGFDSSRWDARLEEGELAALKRSLVDGSLSGRLVEQARLARARAADYLQQEGFLDDGACGVVDLAGVGSQLRALSAMRVGYGRTPPSGFLFLRSQDPVLGGLGVYGGGDPAEARTAVYFDDPVGAVGAGSFRGVVPALEMFCAADHGTVTGYRRVGERVEPVLASDDAPALAAWGLSAVRETVRRFAEHLVLDGSLADPDADLRPTIRELIETFWTSPTRTEAQAWGSFPFEGASGGELTTVTIAAPYELRGLAGAIVRGRLPKKHWFTWHRACAELSPAFVRHALVAAWWFKRAWRGVARHLSSSP